ncbi:MAG: DEAD/DEAH box helicase [Myxococcota bacterium]
MSEESVESFESLGLIEGLLSSLKRLGFERPTDIQAQAIPPLLEGRDVIGRARTGSGKTAAYAIPMLQRIQSSNDKVRGLVLAPTRELALQVTQSIRDLAKGLPVRVVTIYGGAPYAPQLQALASGVPIVVGTPGRVLDHMARGSLVLSDVEFLVLDEADEMLRMGFIDAVEAVIAACPNDRQVALLSATMPRDIHRVATGHLNDPVELQLADSGPRVDHIDQQWIRVAQRNKLEALERILMTSPPGATIVFARTRRGCAEVADALTRNGIAADALHGDLTQGARERVVHRLRSGRLSVVIATDVAARGIDVEHIGRVINLDLPDDAETYVHRIGRTARAGREGEAITFVTSSQRKRLGHMSRTLGAEIRKAQVPTDADIALHHRNRLLHDLQRTFETADLGPAHAWMQDLYEEGWKPGDLAAAALTRLASLEQLDLRPPDALRAPDADPAVDDEEVLHAPIVEVFIGIGDRNGVRPGDLVGAIANEAGISSKHMGRITILHRKSFVAMPEPIAQQLLSQHRQLEIRGVAAKLDIAKGTPRRQPPPRKFRGPRKGRHRRR